MMATNNITVKRKWEIFPNTERVGRWCNLYATLNKQGDIMISRFTHEALGSPENYLLLFDQETQVIGLRAARPGQKDTYPARPRGAYGGQRIRAFRLCRRHAVKIEGTVRFPRAEIDREGILILDLKDVTPFRIRRKPRV